MMYNIDIIKKGEDEMKNLEKYVDMVMNGEKLRVEKKEGFLVMEEIGYVFGRHVELRVIIEDEEMIIERL